MTQESEATTSDRPAIWSAYFRIGAAVLVGASLVLGIYFFVIKDNPKGGNADAAQGLCACPNCGLTIHRPARMDCEEINCPNCGGGMEGAAVLAAAERGRRTTPMPRAAPRMQNRQVAGIRPGAGWTAPTRLPPMGGTGICICPACGRRITRQTGASCSQLRCPSCATAMTNAVFIGSTPASPKATEPREVMPVAMQTPGACPQPIYPQAAASVAPCTPQAPGCISYSNTVTGIISKNCLRCHGGPIRMLTNYHQVKAYVDNGLLMMMVQPGGPMSRFLSSAEAHQIISWIRAGAPP
jgi:hypothetical protein